MDTQLSHLCYCSARKPDTDKKQIEAILKSAERHNPGDGITGVLLYSEDHFIQYIEGKPEALQALYAKIKADPRHEEVMLTSIGPIKDRIFPTWAMAGKSVEVNGKFLSKLSPDEKEVYENILQGKTESRASALLHSFFRYG